MVRSAILLGVFLVVIQIPLEVRAGLLFGPNIQTYYTLQIIEDNSVFIPVAIGDRNRFRKSGKFQMLWLKLRNYRKTEHNRSLIGS